MIEIGPRDIQQAVEAHAAAAGAVALAPARARTPELGPLALRIAQKPIPPVISQVVLTGLVRLTEFLLIAALGIVIYAGYVYPDEGFAWRYLLATGVISVGSVL